MSNSESESESARGFGFGFWLVVGCVLSGSVGCFAIAAAAQSASTDATEIVSVSQAMTSLYGPRERRGEMTERLRHGEMTERVRTEAYVVARSDR